MLSHSLAVLIEVPAIKAETDHASSANELADCANRRDDHLAAQDDVFAARFAWLVVPCWLLVPIVSACTLGWSNRPDRIVACSISDPLQRRARRTATVSADIPPDRSEDQAAAGRMIASRGAVVLSDRAGGRGTRERRRRLP